MEYNDFGLRVEYLEYTVKKGDSLYTIANKYNTTVSTLTDINMLTTNKTICEVRECDDSFDFVILK